MNQDDIIGPVNMGNPDEVTIRHFAEEIKDLTGSNSPNLFKT